MQLQVSKVRLGFATNSSSSHSIVIAETREPVRDLFLGDHEHPSFGWEEFVLASTFRKMQYLGGCILKDLRRRVGVVMATRIVTDLFGVAPGSVDHGSANQIPLEYGYRDEVNLPPFNLPFLKDLEEFFLRTDVVVVGGNDNSDDKFSPPFPHREVKLRGKFCTWSEEEDIDLWFLLSNQRLVARKDEKGFWVLFNMETGTTLTFSFQSGRDTDEPYSTPALVDLKITNKCPYQCSYCYQSSVPNVEDPEINYSIVPALERLKVFEVAIGGGEPTLSKSFPAWLASLHRSGIVSNFTTRNYKFYRNKRLRTLVETHVGGFAFSVDTAEQVRGICNDLYSNELYSKIARKCSFQIVVGAVPYEEIREMTYVLGAGHHHQLTFLDFKDVGRGQGWPPHSYEDFPEFLVELESQSRGIDVGIDTPLARRFQGEWEKLGVSKLFYSTREGENSMYIDIPGGFFDISSYEKDTGRRVPFPKSGEDYAYEAAMLEAFRGRNS